MSSSDSVMFSIPVFSQHFTSFVLCSSRPLFCFLLLLQMLALPQFSFLAVCSSLQALQALQRQPNAAQYFQQLMLQQQINNAAQLQNLAAVQQVKVCANSTLFLSSKGSYKHPARAVCKAQRKAVVRNKRMLDDAVTDCVYSTYLHASHATTGKRWGGHVYSRCWTAVGCKTRRLCGQKQS